MKTQEILSIVALSLLGLCLLCGLSKMAMKGDSAKKNCDKACVLAVFAAVALVGVSQMIGETDGYETVAEKPWTGPDKCGPHGGTCSTTGNSCKNDGSRGKTGGGQPGGNKPCEERRPWTCNCKCETDSDCILGYGYKCINNVCCNNKSPPDLCSSPGPSPGPTPGPTPTPTPGPSSGCNGFARPGRPNDVRCLNGGKAQGKKPNCTCDCSGTGFTGSNCQTPVHGPTNITYCSDGPAGGYDGSNASNDYCTTIKPYHVSCTMNCLDWANATTCGGKYPPQLGGKGVFCGDDYPPCTGGTECKLVFPTIEEQVSVCNNLFPFDNWDPSAAPGVGGGCTSDKNQLKALKKYYPFDSVHKINGATSCGECPSETGLHCNGPPPKVLCQCENDSDCPKGYCDNGICRQNPWDNATM